MNFHSRDHYCWHPSLILLYSSQHNRFANDDQQQFVVDQKQSLCCVWVSVIFAVENIRHLPKMSDFAVFSLSAVKFSLQQAWKLVRPVSCCILFISYAEWYVHACKQFLQITARLVFCILFFCVLPRAGSVMQWLFLCVFVHFVFLCILLIMGSIARSATRRYLIYSRGRFWGFSLRRGNTLHRLGWNLAGRRGPLDENIIVQISPQSVQWLGYRSLKPAARGLLKTQNAKVSKNRHLGTIALLCQAISSQLRHISTIGKKTC